MASSSSSSSFSQSCSFDVFLSFRGEDTRKTFVDHLYSALVDRKIPTYKDDETLPRGESIRPSLFNAIKGSRIAIVVFSKNYADSSWCLDELAYVMECKDSKRGLIVMPVFYDVDPSEVRKQKGKFGEAFSKHDAENTSKVERWRQALINASDIAGWEPKNIANGHEAKVIKEIVDTVSEKLYSMNSYVDEDLVGMSVRLQALEGQLDIGSPGVRMVGIWGIGGSGKTTLASSLYMKISYRFQGHCIIENVREESSKHGLKTLQEKILSRLLKTKTELQSVEEGKHMIRSRLNRSNVLILLDDVDDCKQLDALVGSHKWFGCGSIILITTRDEHVLRTHKVDLVCPVTLLSREEALTLFNKYAYNKDNLVNDYEKLSLHVVSYSNGLPLALKVLGSFLYDKDEKEWVSSLARLKDIPEMEIVKKLKISYDGLQTIEKELFLDIACFFRWKSTTEAMFHDDSVMEVLESCGYHPDIGLKVLKQKALITIVDGWFDMHDLIQEMGHYIVRGELPNNPEKHSRVWKDEEIEHMCLQDVTMENDNIEAIRYTQRSYRNGYIFCKIVSNLKKLRWLSVSLLDINDRNAKGPDFLSKDLQYIRWYNYPGSPFPNSFQPMKLVTLKLRQSLQTHLWKDYKHLPKLKVLLLQDMYNLRDTPNFDGLPCLQKLTLIRCEVLQEIHPSLGKHTSLECVKVSNCGNLRIFPTIVHMGKLKTLEITNCHISLEFPKIESTIESLVKLYLSNIGIDVLLASIGDRCPNLISLNLAICHHLTTNVNFCGLKHLEDVTFNEPYHLEMLDHVGRYRYNYWLRLALPQLTHSLRRLRLYGCHLKDGEIPSCLGDLSNLEELNLNANDFTRVGFSLLKLTRLKILTLSLCKQLVELPKLPSGIVVLTAQFCDSLTSIGDYYTNCKWLCDVSLVSVGATNGSRLLQSMLEGHAIKRHCMLLNLDGHEIAKLFRPPLVRGVTCRLKLPENWSNDYSGFLLCAAWYFKSPFYEFSRNVVLTGVDNEDDVVWEEKNDYGNVIERTWVCYFSFASIRHTTWWDSTYKELLFSLKPKDYICGFGVGLVAKKNVTGSPNTSTTEEESEFLKYVPKVEVIKDSTNALEVRFRPWYSET